MAAQKKATKSGSAVKDLKVGKSAASKVKGGAATLGPAN